MRAGVGWEKARSSPGDWDSGSLAMVNRAAAHRLFSLRSDSKMMKRSHDYADCSDCRAYAPSRVNSDETKPTSRRNAQ